MEEMERLEALCRMVRDTSLCGLGQTAPNPTLSTIRYFRHEYEARLRTGPRAARLKLPVVIPDGHGPARNGNLGGTTR